MTPPSACKERILKAAEELIGEKGAAHLTLDAVAAKAGISKGGLLYHFKTKKALLEALLQAYCDSVCSSLQEQKRQFTAEAKSELHALLLVYFRSSHRPLHDRRLGVGLLGAIANDPELVAGISPTFDNIHDQLWGKLSSFDPDAAILWLAYKGLCFHELIGKDPFNETQREILAARMLELAENRARAISASTKD